MDLERQTDDEPTQRFPVFDGYPYLVTPLGPGLCNFIVLPGDLGIDELLRLARRQHAANRLWTCLALGPTAAMYLSDEGESLAEELPWSNIPVADALMGPEEFPPTAELRERQERLRAFIDAGPAQWMVIDPMRGRSATADELVRLSGTGPDGVPVGLVRCVVCTAYRGDCLSGRRADLVVTVFCRCENHNRCARCLHPLYGWRLRACYYNEPRAMVLHLAASCALSHVCPQREPDGSSRQTPWKWAD